MTSYVEVLDVQMSALPPVSLDLVEVPGLDGAAFAGSNLKPMEITVVARLATQSIDQRDIQRAWADVAAKLLSDEPKALSLVSGYYWMAMLDSRSPLSFATYSATCKLKFTCPDPVAYGTSKTATVPSGGSVNVTVGGTWPASPTITATAAVRNSTSLVWGVKVDNGDFLHVATGSASSRAIAADCGKRTLTVASAAALPTLDSDWLVLAPGTHTVTMDQGTGAATVAWVERWA